MLLKTKHLFQVTDGEVIPEETRVYVEFIMDGATSQSPETHSMMVVVDPYIETEDSKLFPPNFPCSDTYQSTGYKINWVFFPIPTVRPIWKDA